jgi:serine/threonine protein kinase
MTDAAPNIPHRTLAEIDLEFEQLGCLGHGGFGSVFLAKKRSSGRHLAIKVMLLDEEDSENQQSFLRELDAVVKLNTDKSQNRDLAIVLFREWFAGPGFACIVMNFANGGTLLQQIQLQAGKDPYSERRIAFYGLQLSEALAFAHERNVFHHDVKSANVLIDASEAGKLLLADFGTSVAAGEAAVGFTPNYASPELLSAHRREEYEGLEAEKIDAFGLGCILFELLTCRSLDDLCGGQEQTLGDYISEGPGLEAALNLPYVRLPWLSENHHQYCSNVMVGYSHALSSVIKTLLQPYPENRWPPSELQKSFRNDPRSPLISPNVLAAQTLLPGAPVTIDNVQFGMFVQRGVHWNDGEDDGGPGSIGVVVKLDEDAGYTSVVFPSRTTGKNVETLCCRIGANSKFELQVGPLPLPNFYGNTNENIPNGVLTTTNSSKYHVGQLINENCMIVAIIQEHSVMLVAPMKRIQIPSIDPPPSNALGISFAAPREPRCPPWKDSEEGILLEVSDREERQDILELFYARNGGMDSNRYEVTSLKRVQSTVQWDAYARTREVIAADNWGVTNEKRLFHGTSSAASVETVLRQCADFYQGLYRSYGGTKRFKQMQFAERASLAHLDNSRSRSGEMKTIVLARVTLGRVLNQGESPSGFLNYHSNRFESGAAFRCQTPSQVCPEYIITYIDSSQQATGSAALGRRLVRAARPGKRGNSTATSRHLASLLSPMTIGSQARNHFAAVATAQHKIENSSFNLSAPNKGASSSKLCVVCLERPLCRILLPCGHPCLCMECSTAQGISKLRKRCPECRTKIKQVSNIYGRVVND